MIVALVLAVVVAVAAITALLLQRRALAACRAQGVTAAGRADAAEAAAGEAREALDAAHALAASLDAAREAVASTAEEQRAALSASEQRLAGAQDRLRRCAEELAGAQAGLATSTGALERAEAAAEAQRARGQELEALRAAADQLAAEQAGALRRAEGERAALQHRLDQLRVAAAAPAAVHEPSGPLPAAAAAEDLGLVEPCWRLLLARIERQWADAVGAGEGERGVASGPPEEQLHQAVGRELERLREEVGLHTDVARTGATDAAVHPLLVLLAAGELAALAAPHSERVAVELGDPLLVVGEGWSSDPAAAERLRAVVADTGLDGEVVASDDSVRVVVGGRRERRAAPDLAPGQRSPQWGGRAGEPG